jgi:hypothetical protein
MQPPSGSFWACHPPLFLARNRRSGHNGNRKPANGNQTFRHPGFQQESRTRYFLHSAVLLIEICQAARPLTC